MGKSIGMAEFKAHCTRLLRELEQGGEPLTITVRGKPIAIVSAPAEAPRKSLLGLLKGTATENGDIVEPIDPDWEAAWEAKWDARGFTVRAEDKA